MDAKTAIRLKCWARRIFLWPIIGLATIVTLFLLCAWIGSSIPRNSGWTEPEDGIEILIETNGIHTGIVMPLVTPQKDWRGEFPASDLSNNVRPYTHLSISWGERQVFLETPEWTDLTLSKALNAAAGGDGLLHIAQYVRPVPSDTIRPLRLRPSEYAQLVSAIEAQILPSADRIIYAGYDDHDVFYSAPGTYHLGNSCNQWTSDLLAGAGVTTGLWTPMAGGVMKWVPQLDRADMVIRR